jgi:AbrB family looped-hinge helix DNA binding protein
MVIMTKRRNLGSQGFAEEAVPYSSLEVLEPGTLRARTEVGAGGRIVIPAAMRERMGLREGSRLVLLLRGEELLLFTPEAGIRRIQEELDKVVPQGVSLADELIADRRREAQEEEND